MPSQPRPEEWPGGQDPAHAEPERGSPSPTPGKQPDDGPEDRRAEAVKRLEKKRGWTSAMVAYVVVNAFLIGIWASTGRGYFWPGWVLGGWGIGMVLSFWDTFVRRPIGEAEIAAEMRRRDSG